MDRVIADPDERKNDREHKQKKHPHPNTHRLVLLRLFMENSPSLLVNTQSQGGRPTKARLFLASEKKHQLSTIKLQKSTFKFLF
jgi:hypothetical protein